MTIVIVVQARTVVVGVTMSVELTHKIPHPAHSHAQGGGLLYY